MKKIRCLLIDDEPLAAQVLSTYLEKLEYLELAGICHNAIDALNFLQKSRIDLLFLDIETVPAYEDFNRLPEDWKGLWEKKAEQLLRNRADDTPDSIYERAGIYADQSLITVSFALAVPIAWYGVNEWLMNFENHIDVQWWLFVAPGVIVLAIALTVVFMKSFNAAMANPVDQLRNE